MNIQENEINYNSIISSTTTTNSAPYNIPTYSYPAAGTSSIPQLPSYTVHGTGITPNIQYPQNITITANIANYIFNLDLTELEKILDKFDQEGLLLAIDQIKRVQLLVEERLIKEL